jgi:hypothetical protein
LLDAQELESSQPQTLDEIAALGKIYAAAAHQAEKKENLIRRVTSILCVLLLAGQLLLVAEFNSSNRRFQHELVILNANHNKALMIDYKLIHNQKLICTRLHINGCNDLNGGK